MPPDPLRLQRTLISLSGQKTQSNAVEEGRSQETSLDKVERTLGSAGQIKIQKWTPPAVSPATTTRLLDVPVGIGRDHALIVQHRHREDRP